MTNFELVTQDSRTLADFIYAIVDDALEAEGCSLDLKLPYELEDHAPDVPCLLWEEWLSRESKDDTICLPGGVRIERWETGNTGRG